MGIPKEIQRITDQERKAKIKMASKYLSKKYEKSLRTLSKN
ncbi:hypothetical protein [Schinkia azotoformans]|nr:hypothetical protein [Schinkia azotoformans]MEC1697746.1 hypothetical protein [Schinkia azotoformans]